MPRKVVETPEAKAARLRLEAAARHAHSYAATYHKSEMDRANKKISAAQHRRVENEYKKRMEEMNKHHAHFQNVKTEYRKRPSERKLPSKDSAEPKPSKENTKVLKVAPHPKSLKMTQADRNRQEELHRPRKRKISEETRERMRRAQRLRRRKERAGKLLGKAVSKKVSNLKKGK